MYKKYYNEYEKRAEALRQHTGVYEAPPAEPTQTALPQKKSPQEPFLLGQRQDDILLGALIIFMLSEKKADMKLILALAFIFLSGF